MGGGGREMKETKRRRERGKQTEKAMTCKLRER